MGTLLPRNSCFLNGATVAWRVEMEHWSTELELWAQLVGENKEWDPRGIECWGGGVFSLCCRGTSSFPSPGSRPMICVPSYEKMIADNSSQVASKNTKSSGASSRRTPIRPPSSTVCACSPRTRSSPSPASGTSSRNSGKSRRPTVKSCL